MVKDVVNQEKNQTNQDTLRAQNDSTTLQISSDTAFPNFSTSDSGQQNQQYTSSGATISNELQQTSKDKNENTDQKTTKTVSGEEAKSLSDSISRNSAQIPHAIQKEKKIKKVPTTNNTFPVILKLKEIFWKKTSKKIQVERSMHKRKSIRRRQNLLKKYMQSKRKRKRQYKVKKTLKKYSLKKELT